ncbi:MAG TPA: tetratricopeptide repeat protein [Planctomycetota bacterium]|nr:tetratricopeptide repeat protein [Planctomycetota bacterium]
MPMGMRLRGALGMAALGCVLAAAGEPDPAARELARTNEEMQRLLQERSYEKAAEVCRRLIHLAPHEAGPHYNLACALARLGRTPEALAALEMAVLKGFGDPDHMRQDEDLASVRNEPRFARCVRKAEEAALANVPDYEPGAELKGVKTLEGAPEGGLRYRLRMSPAATAEKPDRLVVWLHPAGGSANRVVEPLAERFTKLGYALLVFTQKEWRYWSPADVTRLVEKTLPAVAKTPGLDADRPILMGYSAGGQAALALWQATPGAFGGLVLDAAYPVQRTPAGFALSPLPSDPAARRTPFFVLVGAKDSGAEVWRKAEPVWRAAGVPLTIRYVPDKGHTWLFGPKEVDELAAWLEALKAGKPSAAAEPPKANALTP